MKDEIDYLEKMLSREGESVGFCHNDLQYANMMFQDEDKCLTIIVRILHLSNS
jgi:choline/ethanolamine kinase